jgi:uncharacterized protein
MVVTISSSAPGETNMMKAATAAVLLWMTMGMAWAQEQRAPYVAMNSVHVTAEGKFEDEPDTAMMNFMIAAEDGDSKKAYDKASQAAERVRQVLRSNGVDPKAAELSQYSLQPMRDYRNPKQRILGYRVTTNVTLKLKDFTKIGPIAQGMASIEETENQSLSYMLDNIDAAKQKAIEDGMRKAKASAATVAKSGDRQLGELLYVSLDSFEPGPIPVEMKAMSVRNMAGAPEDASAPTQEFTPGKIQINTRVSAVFGLR